MNTHTTEATSATKPTLATSAAPAAAPAAGEGRAASFEATWGRLTRAAHSATQAELAAVEPLAPPPGFATRVAALALEKQRASGSLWEALSLRALGLAGLTAVLVLVAHFSVPQTVAAPDEALFFNIDASPAIVLGAEGGPGE